MCKGIFFAAPGESSLTHGHTLGQPPFAQLHPGHKPCTVHGPAAGFRGDSPMDVHSRLMHQVVRDGCIGSPVLRTGRASDIDALVDLEAEVFATDRLSRRSFRALLSSRSAAVIVADCGSLCGYAVVLLRRGSSVARLYSLAVNPRAARRGIGKALLAAAEETALARKRLLLRLEVNEHNAVALALYKNAGYRELTYRPHFYEDGTGAQRREKRLAHTYTSLRADVAPTLGE